MGRVKGCTYCYPEEELVLLGGDPALVSPDLAGTFAREVLDHWDPEQYGQVWRSLAPRIVRAFEEDSREATFRGLPDAGFRTWPQAEQDALIAAVTEIVTRVVTSDRTAYETQEYVAAAAHIDRDLTPWLRHLDTLTGPAADRGVAALAEYWAKDVRAGSSPTLWWWPEDPNAALRAWLRSDPLQRRLTRLDETGTLATIAEIEETDADEEHWWQR